MFDLMFFRHQEALQEFLIVEDIFRQCETLSMCSQALVIDYNEDAIFIQQHILSNYLIPTVSSQMIGENIRPLQIKKALEEYLSHKIFLLRKKTGTV